MATMNEQIDELRAMVADLTDRITGIEQRQAKLACSETADIANDDGGNGTDEQAAWDELAKMLGMESVAWMVGYMSQNRTHGFETDEQCERNFKAMLLGLAEGECNGMVCVHGDGEWHWGNEIEDGWADSQPLALASMLKSYREYEDG